MMSNIVEQVTIQYGQELVGSASKKILGEETESEKITLDDGNQSVEASAYPPSLHTPRDKFLTEEVKQVLKKLLEIFLLLGEGIRAIIFTTHSKYWCTDRDPIIITDVQLPSIEPWCRETLKEHIIYGMEVYLTENAHVKAYSWTRYNVRGIPFQYLTRREVHFIFSANPLDRFSNLKKIYYKGANDKLPDRARQTVVVKSCAQVVPASRFKMRNLYDTALLEIVGRLGQYVFTDLLEKMKLFVSRANEENRYTVIFTTDFTLWKTDRSPSMFLVDASFPPVPPEYDHTRFDLAKDVKDFLYDVARQVGFAGFCANCVKFSSGRDSREIHMLLSRHEEPVLSYAKDVASLMPENPIYDEAARSVASVVAYSDDDGSPSNGAQSSDSDTPEIKRLKITSPPVRQPYDTLSDVDYLASPVFETTSDEIAALVSRMPPTLKKNLDEKVKFYLSRSEEAKNAAVIFTDTKCTTWKKDDEIVINRTLELPPIETRYDHKKFDIVQDMVDYLALCVRQNSDQFCTASSLQYGDEDHLRVYLVLSPKKKHALSYLDCQLPYYEQMPPITVSPATIMVSQVHRVGSTLETSEPFKTNVMVKQRVKSCWSIFECDDYETAPTEEGPSTRQDGADEDRTMDTPQDL